MTRELASEEKGRPFVWKRVQPTPAARAAELAAEERIDTSAARVLTLQTLMGCALCSLAGICLVAWSVHTTDEGWGRIAFWSGLLVGDGGMMALLLRHAARRQER